MASEIKQKLADSATATITLTSLANNAGRGSSAIDNSSTLAPRADITVKIKTGSSGASATSCLEVYIIKSENGTTYDDNFGGTDGTFTPINASKIGIISTPANNTSYISVLNTEIAGTLPRKFCIGIVNKVGGTLSSTASDFSVTYTLKTDQTV